MNVFAAACETVVLGEAEAVPGDEAEALDDDDGVLVAAEEADATTVIVGVIDTDEAAELLDELHAVTNTAAHPSMAQPQRAAAFLALREFVVHMVSNPFNSVSGSASHVTSTTPAAPPWLGSKYGPANSYKSPALVAA